MGMPHPRQQPGLTGLARRNLHDDQTVFKVDLLGQEDPGEAAASQLTAKEVRPDFIAGVRQILIARGRSTSGPAMTASTPRAIPAPARAPPRIAENGSK